ncbi:MAG TPA: hypothetical protein VN451_01340 [Chitinophagaceae bacterium]|nr:hypothetical protein [Chitinophagaceae bacterium]
MSLYRILENWSDYDNRKIRTGSEAHLFSCDEPWEVDYLKNKIKGAYPFFSDDRIVKAIEHCCMIVKGPRPRKQFTECVLERLNVLD